MEQQLQEKLKEVKAKIVANSKDSHFAKALIDEFVGLQKQADIEPVELIVPCADVEQTYQIDDVTTLVKTPKGYLYKYGNTFYTYIPFGLNEFFYSFVGYEKMLSKESLSDDEQLTVQALNRAMQWPVTATLDEVTFWDTANASLKIMLEAHKRWSDKINPKETQEDIKANTEFEQNEKALDELVNAPIPDID